MRTNGKKMEFEELEDEELEEEEMILGGGSSLVLGATTEDSGERQEARQRDSEPDDFDLGTDVSDDRVRGAGEQSLDELTIARGQGRGLAEHAGGLRHDRPEPNVNNQEIGRTRRRRIRLDP